MMMQPQTHVRSNSNASRAECAVSICLTTALQKWTSVKRSLCQSREASSSSHPSGLAPLRPSGPWPRTVRGRRSRQAPATLAPAMHAFLPGFPAKALLFGFPRGCTPFPGETTQGLHFRFRKSDIFPNRHLIHAEETLMTASTGLGRWEMVGVTRLGRRLRARLAPGQGERPGRPSDPTWTVQRKLSMSPKTLAALATLAETMSTPERRVSPMQVAALLVEDAAEHLLAERNER